METKPLLYGLIGFFIGGLIVSVAATTFDAPTESNSQSNTSRMNTSMGDMAMGLRNKTGDDFDKAFISGMIVHHEGAVTMARLANENAKHEEIKQLSRDIITAQEKEIAQMKQWQKTWGYDTDSAHPMH